MDIEPLVGVVMGSDSDLPVVKDCLLILEELGIAAEARIMSAHRTPIPVMEYATQAEKRGLKVLIAAAGGASHPRSLPGRNGCLVFHGPNAPGNPRGHCGSQ